MSIETKKAKVDTATFNREWKGDRGTLYYHNITFDNGDSGEYASQAQDQTKFIVGVETEYTIEEKENARGKYFAVKPIYADTRSGGGGGGRPFETPKHKAVTMAMSYTKDLVVAGKVDLMDMKQYFDKIYDAMAERLS